MKRTLLAVAVLGLLAFAGSASAQNYRSYYYGPSTYYPYPYPPAYPVYQSPTQVTGWTPYGYNTAGTTVYNSAYSPWRTASMTNGTMHYVNQPVYGPYGEIVGWRNGEAWTDSVTGQPHFQGNVVTPNGIGGYNDQTVFRSAPPPSNRASGRQGILARRRG